MFKYPEEYLESAASYLKSNEIDFSESKILITGGSGFIGSWLIELLRYYSKSESQKIQILGLSRNLKETFQKVGKENFEFLNWVEGGVDKLPDIEFNFSHALHCATPTTKETGSSDPENVKISSVGGMQHLLEAARLNGNRPRILHTSSGAVYGNAPLVDGKYALNQDFQGTTLDKSSRHYAYAMAKRETELKLIQATKDGYVCGLNARLFAFFGPGLPTTSQYAIGNLIDQALFLESLNLNGTGLATRSYLTGNAMAAAVLYLLSSDLVGATHVGSSNGQALKDWGQIVSEISNKPLQVLSLFDDSSDRYVPDWDERIPRINFEQDHRKVIDRWLKYESSNSKLNY
jgi:nucleoside-diphosphate-sugar epimerase